MSNFDCYNRQLLTCLWRNSVTRYVLLLISLIAFAIPAAADEGHHHDEPSELELGSVHFPISCAPEVQKIFERGVALLHSFAFETAEATFRQVAKDDPKCAMAHWGIASTFSRWGTPSAEQMKQGWGQLKMAKSLHAKTVRERDYIDAIATIYVNPEKKDGKRGDKFLRKLERLHERYPDDLEATAFYAFALKDSDRDDDPKHTKRKEAAAILEKLFLIEPPSTTNTPSMAG